MQQIKLISADKELKIALAGEIDSAGSEDFLAEVCAMYENDKKDVEFECSALEFIDSTTLGTFVKIYKKLKAEGNGMRLTGVRPRIKKLFEICALDKLMEIS